MSDLEGNDMSFDSNQHSNVQVRKFVSRFDTEKFANNSSLNVSGRVLKRLKDQESCQGVQGTQSIQMKDQTSQKLPQTSSNCQLIGVQSNDYCQGLDITHSYGTMGSEYKNYMMEKLKSSKNEALETRAEAQKMVT